MLFQVCKELPVQHPYAEWRRPEDGSSQHPTDVNTSTW